MADVATSSTVEILQYLHEALAAHFADLRDTRAKLRLGAPVFALEHDLSAADLDLLRTTVRAAVQSSLGARYRQWWLPFVVYAAESGYDYVGPEYWRSFEQSTPGWRGDQRLFVSPGSTKFAAEYGGAIPTGAFASNFTIIAWPITHAVLPTYLQRHLAQLLFEFSGALTSDLLDDPEALGVRLVVVRRTTPSASASSVRTPGLLAKSPSHCSPARTSRRHSCPRRPWRALWTASQRSRRLAIGSSPPGPQLVAFADSVRRAGTRHRNYIKSLPQRPTRVSSSGTTRDGTPSPSFRTSRCSELTGKTSTASSGCPALR